MNDARAAMAQPREPTPMESLCAFVGAGAMMFYWAEKDENPAVRSYWDAFHYIATCLSVGYANIFPVTQLGKAIGAAVMMAGPALSAGALAEKEPPDASVPAKLDAILDELRKLNARQESLLP